MKNSLPGKIILIGASLFLSACFERTAPPAPVTQLGTHLDSAAGAVMVREGDTLWNISQRYRLSVRDIIDLNEIDPPYAIRDGQRLKLPPPVDYRVGANDTLYGVSRMFGVPVSQLVKMNNLPPPYRLAAGQVLRIPSPAMRERVRERGNIVAAVVAAKPSIAAPTPHHPLPSPQPSPAVREREIQKPITTLAAPKRQDFVWPVKGRVVSGYGPKEGGLYNEGINIAAPKGTPVAAAANGVVAYVGSDLKSYGNLVLIRHGGGTMTAYAHLSAINVKKGQSVKRGQAIGTIGSSGSVETSQLHFEVRKGGNTLDPKKFLL